jgi:hypothetical protein
MKKEEIMKIAFCLHGIANGKNFKHGGLNVSYRGESELYKSNFILPNSADVFLHSWSTEVENDLIDLYNPKSSLFEPPETVKGIDLFVVKDNIRRLIKGRALEFKRKNNIYCRWLSFKKVIDIMSEYEKSTGIQYDMVMISRFDLSLMSRIQLIESDLDSIIVPGWTAYRDSKGNRVLEDQAVNCKDSLTSYERGFPNNDEGLLDFFCIVNRKDIDSISQIYSELGDRIKEGCYSNHKILLNKIIDMNALGRLDFSYKLFRDFNLTRWI